MAQNKDYTDLANEIVDKIGGKDNIINVINCMTRLRFKLKDEGKADTAAVKKIKGVQGVVVQGGQYQIIIGTHVKDVVKFVEKAIGPVKDADVEEPKQEGILAKLFQIIAGCVISMIPALVSSGVIKGVLAILTTAGVLTTSDGTYIILYATSNAALFFLPIMVGFNAGKVFGCNPMVAATIGAALVYPSLSDVVTMIHPEYAGVETAPAALSFLGIPVQLIDYSSSMLPIILAVFLAACIQKYAEKIIPQMLQLIFVPVVTMAITVPVTFLVIGPVMTMISNGLSTACLFIYNHVPLLGGLIFGGFWQLFVVMGIHGAITPVLFNNLFTLGYDPINACMGLSVWAVAGAGLGYGFKIRNKEKRSMGFSNTLTALCGITEPSIYSMLLPHAKLFGAVIAGGGISGMILAALGGKMYSWVGDGIFRIPGMINPAGLDISFYGFIVCAVISFAVSAVIAFFLTDKEWDREELSDHETGTDPAQAADTIHLHAFADGKMIDIENVKDATFAQKILGDGVAIEPDNEVIVSPADAVVTAVMDTRHAIGLKLSNGIELLLHVGIDTVNMKGEGFEVAVTEGQKVRTGEKLLSFQADRIASAGYSKTTMLVVTDMAEASAIEKHTEGIVSAGETVIVSVK